MVKRAKAGGKSEREKGVMIREFLACIMQIYSCTLFSLVFYHRPSIYIQKCMYIKIEISLFVVLFLYEKKHEMNSVPQFY